MSLSKPLAIACLARITRSGDRHTIQRLRECRDQWPARRAGDFVEEKLAFTLGWRRHNARRRLPL